MDVKRRNQIRAQLPELDDFGFPDKERRDVWTVPRSPLGLQDGALCLLYWKGRPRAVVADTGSVSAEDVEAYALGPAFEQSPPAIVLSRQGEIRTMELKGSSYALTRRMPLWDDVLKKEPGRISAAQAEAVVEEVAADNREWYEDDKSQAVIGAVPRIFPEGTAIVYEILQNAADCGAKRAAFNWKDDTLYFLHDGSWFTENDVEAISFINVSFKPPDNIGFMGLGFKAVYEVCDRPQIHSEPYYFLFDQGKDGGKLFPEWIPPDGRAVVPEPFTTLFRIPIQRDEVEELRWELSDFAGRSLLYTGLSELEIDTRVFSCRRLKSGVLDSDAAWSVVRLDQSDKDERSYLLLSRSFGPSDEAAEEFADNRGRNATPESYRGSAGHREEVTLTVELQGNGSPRRVLGSGNLQVYLPTSIELGCPFDLQGNFIIDASRQQIKSRSGPWNAEYLAQAGVLLADLLSYSRHLGQEGSEGWERFYSLIPDDFGFFGGGAEKIFVDQLEERELVPIVDGAGRLNFVAPYEARRLAPRVDQAVPASDLVSLAGIRPLWPNLGRTGKARLGSYLRDFSVESFLECLKQPDWEKHISDFADGLEAPEAFRRLAHILALDCLREGEVGWSWKRKRRDYESDLRECRVLLDEEVSLRAVSGIPPVRLLPPTGVDFPTEELRERFALVNRRSLDALRNPIDFGIDVEVAEKALEELELLVPVLTAEQIAKDVVARAFKDWEKVPDDHLIRYTQFLAKHQHKLSDWVLKGLGVKLRTESRKREYVEPEELYFRSEYGVGFWLERLCETANGIDYVSTCYLEDCDNADLVRLFRLLGVADFPRIKSVPRVYHWRQRDDLKRDAGDPELDLPKPKASASDDIPAWSWLLEDYTLDAPVLETIRMLYSDKPEGWHGRLKAFAILIDRDWKQRCREYLHKKLKYYRHRGTKRYTETQSAPSSLADLLKNQPWVPVEGADLALTADKLVLPTTENRDLAGDTTLFPAYDFSDESLLEFLEIQRHPPKATPLGRLRYLVSMGPSDVEDLRAAYRAVAADTGIRDAQLRAVFRDEELIFVPESASFVSSHRVIYRRHSALSSYFAPIESAYPDLKSFFVDRLGIAEQEQVDHYIRFLRDYAWDQKPSMSDEVRAGVGACYRGLLNYLAGHADGTAVEELGVMLGDDRFVYCTNEGWTETRHTSDVTEAVFYPDVQRHIEEIGEVAHIESHLTRLDRPLSELQPLIALLRLTPLSRAVTEKAEPQRSGELDDDVQLRDDLSKLIAVVGGVWRAFDQETRGMARFRDHWAEVERRLARIRFYWAERLTVAASLGPIQVSEDEKRVFLQEVDGNLRIYVTGPVLGVYDDLVEQLCSWLRFDLLPRRLRERVHNLVFGNVARLGEPSFEALLATRLEELGLWEDSFAELLGAPARSFGDDGGQGHEPRARSTGGGGGGGRPRETVDRILVRLPRFSEQSLDAEAAEYDSEDWQPAFLHGSKAKGWGGGSSEPSRTKQRAYGKRGEQWAFRREQRRLSAVGREDLADRVLHRASTDPGCPHDIESFEKKPPHEPILIEVKSTADSEDFDFRLSAPQIREGCQSEDAYYIYRVTEVASDHPKLHIYPFEDIWPSSVQMKSGELVVRAPRPPRRS